MSRTDRILWHFDSSVAVLQRNAQRLAPVIEAAALLLIESLRENGKILICGNGGAAADAQHFAAELLNRFEVERRGLAGLALTTDTSTLTSIANDYSFDDVFARQVEALVRPADVLFVIITLGNLRNLLRAVAAARERGIRCVALNGRDGGELTRALTGTDVNILVQGDSTARVQEVHGVIIHCLCDLIDKSLSG